MVCVAMASVKLLYQQGERTTIWTEHQSTDVVEDVMSGVSVGLGRSVRCVCGSGCAIGVIMGMSSHVVH